MPPYGIHAEAVMKIIRKSGENELKLLPKRGMALEALVVNPSTRQIAKKKRKTLLIKSQVRGPRCNKFYRLSPMKPIRVQLAVLYNKP
jgi:hypothetical protein